FHVVILDMNFSIGATSGKEGFYWLKTIRELSQGSQVVMMTAYGDIDLAIKAMKDGAADFVIKPWENERLLEAVSNAFKQSLMHADMAQETPVSLDDHAPASQVDRIFMFLDIRSSTAIAERLGHEKYFALLQDFFADISEPIVKHEGEIYQYVGDEVVITWPLEVGVTEARCIHCFYAICDAIQLRREHYQVRYGILPQFKAGLHHGQVTTGRVGRVKKEVVFSGDVLNTTSRIEGMCNRYQADFLVSKDLLDLLAIDDRIAYREIGSFLLRGKQEEVVLYQLERAKLSS
ncbi:MAG: adenylate/guanylate cyclase domain-containing protein, partial [Bacteroidota bacterium]